MLTINLPEANFEGEFPYNLPGHSIKSSCYFRYYLGQQNQAKQIIIFTELKDNPGASITNAAEYLFLQFKEFLLQNYGVNLRDDAILIEHYEANYYQEGEERFALFDKRGRFQYLECDRLNLIFEENYGANWSVVALLDSWASEEDEEEDQKETWQSLEKNLRHSPFVIPQLEFWTIYQNLPSYANKFVALKFVTSIRTDELIVKDSLEEIRDIMEQEGRKKVEPQEGEETTVVEMWV